MRRLPAILSLFAISTFNVDAIALSAPIGNQFQQVETSQTGYVQKIHGCHANTRYNYVDEIGEEARHRHKGNNCRPVIIESHNNNNHCHADGRKHGHSGVGNTVHSHVGNSCRVDVWNQSGGSKKGQGCIKVGPVLFCP